MSKILMVSLRTHGIGSSVAVAEYNDVLRATQMPEENLDHLVVLDESFELPNLQEYSGIIVGGSSLNVTNEADPEAYSPYQKHVNILLKTLVECGKPVFLICFGASWLADFVGGEVNHQWAEDSGVSLVELTQKGKEDVLCKNLPSHFDALTGHTEAIGSVTARVEVLATGPTCPFQLLRYGKNVWASQFHLEMNGAAMKTRMDFYKDYGYFKLEDYESIVAEVSAVDTSVAHSLLANFVSYCEAA